MFGAIISINLLHLLLSFYALKNILGKCDVQLNSEIFDIKLIKLEVMFHAIINLWENYKYSFAFAALS